MTLVIRTYTKISCANAGKFDLPHALRILKIRNADKNTKICRAKRVNSNGNILYTFLIDENIDELIHPDEYTCYRQRRL